MQLIDLCWDYSNNLIFEFEKEVQEEEILVPEMVSRANIKFNISRAEDTMRFSNSPPYLVSVKELFFSPKTMCFTIDLDQLNCPNDLKITVLQLAIFFVNGEKLVISFNEVYNFSELSYKESYYKEEYTQNVASHQKSKSRITEEKIFKKIQRDFKKNTEETTFLYHRSEIENEGNDNSNIALIEENNERLRRVEEELKIIMNLLKSLKFNGNNIPVMNQYSSGPPKRGIERIKKPPNKKSTAQQSILYLGELKTILKKGTNDNKEFDLRQILKPMSENELRAITLNDETLIIKQEEAINNEIKRLENKKNEKISLENLKKPKKASLT